MQSENKRSDADGQSGETAAAQSAASQSTALYELHRAHGGKLVEFAGWHLPIQYAGGIMAEHHQCREAAALFDVSHMTQLIVGGDNATGKLESLIPADLEGLPVGKARYTCLTNNDGGVIDDLIATRTDKDWYLVVNASRRDAVLKHLHEHLPTGSFHTIDDRALIALQGPKAEEVLITICTDCKELSFMESQECRVAGIECRVSRLGYTGEDGFEIAVSNEHALELAEQLLQHESCAPAGLGARDSLRLEAGLCLYGQDLDTSRTLVEAGLVWTIAPRRREAGGFPGDTVIQHQIKNKPTIQLIGMRLEGRVPARQGAEILNEQGEPIGTVTSGLFSPTLGSPIAIGYVRREQAAVDSTVHLKVRNKLHAARLCALPFVPHRYKR